MSMLFLPMQVAILAVLLSAFVIAVGGVAMVTFVRAHRHRYALATGVAMSVAAVTLLTGIVALAPTLKPLHDADLPAATHFSNLTDITESATETSPVTPETEFTGTFPTVPPADSAGTDTDGTAIAIETPTAISETVAVDLPQDQ